MLESLHYTQHGKTWALAMAYHACEAPLHTGSWWTVHQPVSCAIDAVTTLMLAGHAAFSAQSIALRIMLASYAAFEGWHTLSHLVHLPSGSFQASATHLMSYCVCSTTLMAVVYLSPRQQLQLNRQEVLLVLAALLLDTWACVTLGGLWMVASGLGLLVAVVLSQWASLPKFLQAQLPEMLGGVAAQLLLFANEAINCKRMLKWKPLPYHAAIEVLRLWLLYRLARAAVRWDAAVALEHRHQPQYWHQPLMRRASWHLLRRCLSRVVEEAD